MKTEPLIDAMREHGLLIYVQGGRLKYKARRSLPDDLRQRLIQHREELAATARTLREHVADLIRQARRTGRHDLAWALLDAYRERMAICTIDGGASETEAEGHALDCAMALSPRSTDSRN